VAAVLTEECFVLPYGSFHVVEKAYEKAWGIAGLPNRELAQSQCALPHINS